MSSRAGAAPRSRGLRADRRAGRTGAAEPPAGQGARRRGAARARLRRQRGRPLPAREGLAHGCTEAETALALQGLGGYPILKAAQPEVRDAWLPRLTSGDVVAAFALSEPDAGSDAAALTLKADRDGDGFRLGTKLWISNAPEADVYSVFARTSDERARGITAPSRATPTASRASTSSWSLPDRQARLRRGVRRCNSCWARSAAVSCSRWTHSICSGRASAPSASEWDRRRSTRRLPRPAAGVRKAARRLPGGGAPARRRGDAAAGRPPARRGRGGEVRLGCSTRAQGVGDGEALRDGDCAAGGRRRDPGARGAGAEKTICSNTSTVRCARRASTRAPPRSSARSLPGAVQGSAMSKDKSLTYTSYLALEEILAAQRPRSTSTTRRSSSSSTRCTSSGSSS